MYLFLFVARRNTANVIYLNFVLLYRYQALSGGDSHDPKRGPQGRPPPSQSNRDDRRMSSGPYLGTGGRGGGGRPRGAQSSMEKEKEAALAATRLA